MYLYCYVVENKVYLHFLGRNAPVTQFRNSAIASNLFLIKSSSDTASPKRIIKCLQKLSSYTVSVSVRDHSPSLSPSL